MACVDKATATPVPICFCLRQYLSGKALKVVEPLRHSAAAYEAQRKDLKESLAANGVRLPCI